jgi:CBS domain-containing protein
MKAADVMVSKVITVEPDTSVRDIANILLANRISAVPVVNDGGKIVGIVSEGDLIRRVEAGTERRHSWWLELVGDRGQLARDYLKAHATRAAHVMTKPVVVAPPDMSLAEIATLLERHRIKRVPIVDEGRLVGIVSRANLLQALAAMQRDRVVERKVDDSVLRERISNELAGHALAHAFQINIIVHEAVVELWGMVGSRDERDAIRVAAETVEGVRKVENHLAVGSQYHMY